MPEKTGKSLDQWKSLLKTQSFEKHMEAVNFLKKEHNVSHGFANTIISLSKEDPQKSEDLVATQYKGKEALLSIYDRLLHVTTRFGQDVTVTPKKTSVSIIRKKQFALIRPATKTRIDLGLKLKDVPITKRLENSGPFGSMCTHRVRLESTDAIDDELIQWLQDAYDKAN